MPVIRLTEATWKERELGRVRSILRHQLDRTGMDQDKLARLLLRYLATEYTSGELIWFRDQLVSEGVIEVVGDGAMAAIKAALALKKAEVEPMPEKIKPEPKKRRLPWGKKKR